jgi:hypothetical protein
LYSAGKSRDLILSGTTFENMLLKYARKQRASIYHPATIDDLPFEVLREAFVYLKTEDLVSSSRVNRSWRPAAQDVQRSQLIISKDHRESLDPKRLLCGIQLTRIVFGYNVFSIKHLVIDLGFGNRAYIPILARMVAPNLRTLELDYFGVETSSHYVALDQFFSQCRGIRNIKLNRFYFGEESTSISQTIKDGFYRLSQLGLFACHGDLRMFVVSVPIPNLLSLNNAFIAECDNIISFAMSCPSIKILSLYDFYDSSATLLKFVECCSGIEELTVEFIVGEFKLHQSDIEAIASLPRLKSLRLDCRIDGVAISTLFRCKGLTHLAIRSGFFDLASILSSIGRSFVSLEYNSSISCLKTVNAIVRYCPNLQMLNLGWVESEKDNKAAAVELLKRGLIILSKLKLNHNSVRLGTDWKGYR